MSFEKSLHEFARSNHKDLLDMINKSLDYNDDVASKMKSTLDDFKANGVW
jgi:F-type H+-transporting ATPase subunit alpha